MNLSGHTISDDAIHSLLNQKRMLGDEPADQFMREIVASGDNVFAVRAMPGDERVQSFLREHGELPGWADPELIRQGQDLFFRYGMTIVTLLFFSALPEGYACSHPAKVLVHTGKLVRGTEILHRILRTAQFIIDVMTPGGLEVGGRGIQTTLQIRLLHAAVRSHLVGEKWVADDRTLINQEELLGTLYTFSVLMLEGMKKFNVDFTDEEERAYMHVWDVTGYFMGVHEDLLRQSPADASRIFHTVRGRIQSPCNESKQLTRALLNFLYEMIPGEIMDGFADTLMRSCIGDQLADDLDVGQPDWTETVVPMLRVMGLVTDDIGDNSPTASWVFQKLYAKIIHGLMAYYSRPDGDGLPPLFVEIPRVLRQRWGIGEPAV